MRVFIGSPGGLEEERRAAHEIVEEINLSNSEHWGCQIKLVGWEDTIPGFQRPQSRINQDLDKCDYFIGVLWNHWGTKPDLGEDGYTSGFEEEYYRARSHIEDGRMKDLVVYFKNVEVPDGLEPGEKIKKVLEFRQQCIEDKKFMFKDFASTKGFRDSVRSKLTDIGWQETELTRSLDSGNRQIEQAPQADDKTERANSSNSLLIDQEALEFVTELSKRSSEWDQTSPYEIARFRLIAASFNRSGNDDLYLGNHDANLIFKNRDDASFSDQEIRALVDCGIVGITNQNVPLWHWLSISGKKGLSLERAEVLAIVGGDQEKKNAIKVLQIASQSIPSLDDFFDRERVLTSWLSEDTNVQIFDAAISFLTSNAENDDIELLERIASDNSPQRKGKIESAIIGILSRTSIETAMQRLITNEVGTLDELIAEKLFQQPQSLTTKTVTLCLEAKPDNVRLRAVKLLFDRDEITLEAAQSLLTDSNHEIRLLAAESLKKLGHKLDNSLVKKALTIERPKGLLGAAMLKRNETDATYHERYLSNRLAELSLVELRKRVLDAGVFNERELSVMYTKYKSETQAEIREQLADGYSGHFESKIKREVDRGRLRAETIPTIRNLEAHLRKGLCSVALTVLCSLGHSKDLDLVRNTIDEFEVNGSDSILKFLGKFGDWTDIERVKSLGDQLIAGLGLWGMSTTQMPRAKARTILTLGQNRIADVLALKLDGTIAKSLVTQFSKRVVIEFSDEILMKELNRKDDDYRIIFALKCVDSLPKSRIIELLDKYVSRNEQRYYNSIHWLDLGASIPQKLARMIAKQELANRSS